MNVVSLQMHLSKAGSVLTVTLMGELTVADATTLQARLAAAIDADCSIVLNTGRVTRVDTAITQMILRAARRARGFQVDSASAAWCAAWSVLGMGNAQASEPAGRVEERSPQAADDRNFSSTG
jgi:ABC-type transporter Mla MlaB component